MVFYVRYVLQPESQTLDEGGVECPNQNRDLSVESSSDPPVVPWRYVQYSTVRAVTPPKDSTY